MITEPASHRSIPYPLVFAAVIWSWPERGVSADRQSGYLESVLQPAGRSGLSQGACAGRRRSDPRRSADRARIVFSDIRRNYFPTLSELHVLQYRSHRLSAGRRRFSVTALLAPTIVSGRITLGA